MSSAAVARESADEAEVIASLVRNARAAMVAFADADQARTDEAVTALAWSLRLSGPRGLKRGNAAMGWKEARTYICVGRSVK